MMNTRPTKVTKKPKPAETYRALTPLFDSKNLWDFTVGFDSLFDQFEQLFRDQSKTSFPQYNIEKVDGKYYITLSVSGYTENDLTVETIDRSLYVRGESSLNNTGHETKTTYHRGLAGRKFERAFTLADGVEVTNVVLSYGLLTIELTEPEDNDKHAGIVHDIKVDQ